MTDATLVYTVPKVHRESVADGRCLYDLGRPVIGDGYGLILPWAIGQLLHPEDATGGEHFLAVLIDCYVFAEVRRILFIAIARLLRRIILQMLYRRGVGVDKAIIVGSGEAGRSVIRTLLARPDLGYDAIGYLSDEYSEESIGSGRIPFLGDWSLLASILRAGPHEEAAGWAASVWRKAAAGVALREVRVDRTSA